MKYTKTRRTDNICNICGKVEQPHLSWDHVPPKGGIDLSSIEIRNYTNGFKFPAMEREFSQDGLKFRTICKCCNSELGSRYDKTFNKLMLDVKRIVTSSIILPSIIKVNTNPTKIIKSVLGHVLASKTLDCKTIIDNITRDYLFNENAILSEDLIVYYWFYPYDCTIIKNDVVQFYPMLQQTLHYSLIKCFPLGFAIAYKSELNDDFRNLSKYNTNDINREVEISLKIDTPFNWDYPEKPRRDEIQFISDNSNAVFASKKQKRVISNH